MPKTTADFVNSTYVLWENATDSLALNMSIQTAEVNVTKSPVIQVLDVHKTTADVLNSTYV